MKRLVGLLLMAAAFAFAADQVPFVAVFTSSVPGGTPPTCPGGQVGLATVGTGHATHVGLFTSWERICFDPIKNQFTEGTFELTAANGDTITGTPSGFLELHGTTATIHGAFLITGGTGRFSGASGGGTATGTLDLTTGIASDFVMTGKITRPNH